jgi:hypothetical protein
VDPRVTRSVTQESRGNVPSPYRGDSIEPNSIKEEEMQQLRSVVADNVKTWRNEHQALVEEADVDQESATNEHIHLTDGLVYFINVDETGLRTSIRTFRMLSKLFSPIKQQEK